MELQRGLGIVFFFLKVGIVFWKQIPQDTLPCLWVFALSISTILALYLPYLLLPLMLYFVTFTFVDQL